MTLILLVNKPEDESADNNEETGTRGKFQYEAKDGTVAFCNTIEELQKLREEERENAN